MKTKSILNKFTIALFAAAVVLLAAAATLFGAPKQQTASAATAAELQTTITAYGLTAVVSGNTVTVTGSKADAATALTLDIGSGVTVIWRADLSGSIASPNALVNLAGTGIFTAEIGIVTQTGTGYSISVAATDSAVVINIQGAAVSATSGRAINNAGADGAVNVLGGTVTAATGYAIYNGSSGTVNVSGGTVTAATGYAIYNGSSGTVNVSGGTVTATGSGYAIYGGSSGTVNVSGGTVSSTSGVSMYLIGDYAKMNITGGTIISDTGRAVYHFSYEEITISQADDNVPTILTSKNVNSSYGTVTVVGYGGATYNRLKILGGTITNTSGDAASNTVYIGSGIIEISGGEISSMAGRAVNNAGAGIVNISGGEISSTEGRAIHNNSSGIINISDGEVSATDGGIAAYNYSTGAINISGGAVTATLGNNNDINNIYAVYNYSTGMVNVLGGEASSTAGVGNNASAYAIYNFGNGTVNVSAGAVDAEIQNYYGYSYAICNFGALGTVNISGGAVGVTGTYGYAVYNEGANGKVNISGGAVSAMEAYSYAIVNTGSNSEANISGGTINTTSTYAIYNAGINSAANISGGTVSSVTGTALYLYGTNSTANISGGNVISETGIAVDSYSYGAVTVSQAYNNVPTLISSANVNPLYGTIYIRNFGSALNLVITGGTITNTSGDAAANTIRINSGSAEISGGTINAVNGCAIYSATSGAVTVSQADAGSPTLITSKNIAATGGTVMLMSSGGLDLFVSTIENTAGGNIIYNPNKAGVKIADAEFFTQSSALEKIYDGTGSIFVLVQNLFRDTQVQWYKNGAPIVGAGSVTLHVASVADSGIYECRVRNAFEGYESGWAVSALIFVEITPRIVTVTANAANKAVDAADPVLTYTHTGLFGNDAFTGALTRVPGEAIGTYAINKGTLGINDNYILAFAGSWLTVTEPLPVIKDGTDGKSAYELWLEAGNTGSLQDFLESLKAPKNGGGCNSVTAAGDGFGFIGFASVLVFLGLCLIIKKKAFVKKIDTQN